MSIRSVLALFVKDEEEDIAWWLSWHLAIGFSTIIVYDDRSNDKTALIVQAASHIYDVRLRSSVPSLRFNHRQKFTYEQAIEECRNEFDWMMFLDSDEYLDISHWGTIDKFIDSFPAANAIAINWRCFGSGGHICKPTNSAPFLNYLYSSRNESIDANRIVKSIFKLSKTESIYINPHHFCTEGLYASAEGGEMEWDTSHPERSVALPKWEGAYVRHYAVRSLAHFLEKMARRSDIRGASFPMNYFNDFNFDEVYDPPNAHIVKKCICIIASIRKSYEDDMLKNAVPAPLWQPLFFVPSFRVFKIVNNHGYIAAISKDKNQLVSVKEGLVNEKNVEVNGIVIDTDPSVIYLLTHEPDLTFMVQHDERVGSVLSYHLEQSEADAQKLGLRNPHSGRSICWMPPHNHENQCLVEANRDWIFEWEEVSLQEKDDFSVEYFNIVSKISQFSFRGEIKEELTLREHDAVISFISSRNHKEILEWEYSKKIVLPFWVSSKTKISL